MTHKSFLYGIGLAALLSAVYMFGASAAQVFAGAPSGVMTTATVATTTAVGPQQNVRLFSATNCNSRIISTVASPIMLTFFDPSNGDLSSTTLSGTKGVLQPASTTVAYDSGQYGCGVWYAYAFSSTTITTVSTR